MKHTAQGVGRRGLLFAFSEADGHQGQQWAYSNGMDAPAFYGISCAKVEMSSYHLIQQERPR
jgi:hypothetical protein